MESKIMIDIDYETKPVVSIRQKNTEDVRDRLVALFVQTAAPNGYCYDGYARVSRLQVEDDGIQRAEITPIHPMEMVKHFEMIRDNAKKFSTFEISAAPEEIKYNENPEMTYAEALEMVDVACVEKLPHDLYKKWKDIMFDLPQRSSQR